MGFQEFSNSTSSPVIQTSPQNAKSRVPALSMDVINPKRHQKAFGSKNVNSKWFYSITTEIQYGYGKA